jgi:DNA-directed RNA polymerase I subunit RPA43
VLAHSGLSFGAPTARVLGDSPFAAADVRFAATTWAPAPGMRVRGRLVLAGPDHAALLVHRTFNAAVPRAHIPPAWAFEHGPAENDPEFGAGADGWGADGAEGAGGRWVSLADGAPLGGEDGIVEFTVIGCALGCCSRSRVLIAPGRMTVSHQMLSLVGSLQPDPFSPRHAVQAAPTPAKGPAAAGRAPRAVVQDEEEDEATFPEDTFGDGDADDAGAGDGEEEDEGGDGVEDAFAALGALADADVAAARAEREREEAEREEARAKAEKAERKERKRKAKEEGRDEKKRRKEQTA